MYTVNELWQRSRTVLHMCKGVHLINCLQHDWIEPEQRLNLEKASFLLHEGLGMLCAYTAYQGLEERSEKVAGFKLSRFSGGSIWDTGKRYPE